MTGDANVCVGYTGGLNLTSGAGNVCLGAAAGSSITTGGGHICIGQNAGSSTTTAANSICIGLNTALSVGSRTSPGANEIVIGNGVIGKGTNTCIISAGAGSVYQGNDQPLWATVSDFNIKKDIIALPSVLSKIMKLKPVSFTYKETDKLDIGFIAQDYETVFPEQIIQCDPTPYQSEILGLDKIKGIQQNLTPYLVKAIQEQNVIITDLLARITALEAKLQVLTSLDI